MHKTAATSYIIVIDQSDLQGQTNDLTATAKALFGIFKQNRKTMPILIK